MIHTIVVLILMATGPSECMKFYKDALYQHSERCFVNLYQKSGDPDFLYGAAYSAYMAHRYRKALELVKKLLKARPHYGDGWFLKGLVHEAREESFHARYAYQRALREGLDTEDPKELMRRLSLVKKKLHKRDSVQKSAIISIGYDSKPFASDLGELMTSEEDPALFLGFSAKATIPLSIHDSHDWLIRLQGEWRVFADGDSFAPAPRGTRGAGRLMNPSEGLFGYGDVFAGLGYRMKGVLIHAGGVVDAYDPSFSSGLAGGYVALEYGWAWHGLDAEVDLSARQTTSYDPFMEPFAGTSVDGLYLQEIPWTSNGTLFLTAFGSVRLLGVSTGLDCTGEVGCPERIEWDLVKAGLGAVSSWVWGDTGLLLSMRWEHLYQWGDTVVNVVGGSETLHRNDDRVSVSGETSLGAFRVGVTWTRSWSNADYESYDFNFDRVVVHTSLEW